MSGALGRLLAVSENYPDLKSNANFLALQSQLEGTENRIAVARRDYIEAVRVYNTALRTFPTLIWAKTLFAGNKPMAEFTASRGLGQAAASEILIALVVPGPGQRSAKSGIHELPGSGSVSQVLSGSMTDREARGYGFRARASRAPE